MSVAAYLAFCGLCVVLALTPGPDTFLTLRYSLLRVRTGLASAAGSSLGSLIWAALVGIGLAALLEQSADAYRVVKILGGAYLLFLGIRAFWQARRARASADALADDDAAEVERAVKRPRGGAIGAFGAGLLSCCLNPKVGLFFLAIVPQFLPAHGDRFALTMVLGATDAVISMVYLASVSVVAARANAWLKRPRVTRMLERISGGILAALGLGTITAAVVE
ncbi:MAG TPA: LysE family translocator [Galbitalea sp.]